MNISAIRTTHQRGSILVVAMIVSFAMVSMLLALSYRVNVAANAASNIASARQADAVERGAEQAVLAILTDKIDSLTELNESDFEKVAVPGGYFWIIRPDYGDTNLDLYGLVDESTKIDLNTATYAMLQKVPGLTEPIAGSIVDWRDADDTPTGSGSESIAYAVKTPAYQARNAPFETVEELLLVDGMTRDLLYGPEQSVASASTLNLGSTSSDRYFVAGVFDDFTIWNTRPNTNSDGEARVNINDIRQRGQLRTLLRTKIGGSRGDEIANQLGNAPFIDMFDMARRTSMTSAELALVEGSITTSTSQQLAGLINVNSAPREVLLALPNLTSSDVDALIANRTTTSRTDDTSVAWVYDVLHEKAVGIGNSIAGRGYQFSAEILSVSSNGRAFKRVRIVVDASGSSPQIVYRRDRTAMGWPLDTSILKQLRSGQNADTAILAQSTMGVRTK